MRGELYQLAKPRGAMGHEQAGPRYAVVVQSDFLPLSTWVVVPTSASAPPQPWRPEIMVEGRATRVLTEQIAAITPERLGKLVGILTLSDMQAIDQAIKEVLNLR